MLEDELINAQLRFFVQKRAGCLFAAAAARDPSKYGWGHRVLVGGYNASNIDQVITVAIDDPGVSTISLLFPTVSTADDLVGLILTLKRCRQLTLEQTEEYADSICFGFRTLVGPAHSYVTGFGNYPFLPQTRRAPCVELTTRVKPRPQYEFVFKEAPPGTIHLADMNMVGMERDKLWELWNNSFTQTESVLGAKPDLRSAARTTYSLPKQLCHNIL